MARRRKSSLTARRGVGVHQGRVVLVAGVEQVASAGLDHTGQAATVERLPDQIDLPRQDRRLFVGVQRSGVQGDGDAGKAFIGQQFDGVEQAMMGQAVGVVAESHDVLI